MRSLWTPGPVLIAGPCVLEDDSLNLRVAHHLAELASRLGIRVVFKASFDKANRASAGAVRGPGLQAGLPRLARVKAESGLPVLTDIHESCQAAEAAAVADALQIPALLCRQTDLLTAAGATGLPINIKKGQWASAEVMIGAVEKARASATSDVAVTERGSFFGYGDLVVDMRNFHRIRRLTGCPVFYDATHAVQRPGMGPGGSSAGAREHTAALMRAAAAAGAEGFFVETHPEPDSAPSDAATMWPLADLEDLVGRTMDVWHAASPEPART